MLVVMESLFKMMENGLYPVSKLQVILLHLLHIRSFEGNQSNEELVIDNLCKYWSRAIVSWLPQQFVVSVCKMLTMFLLKKTVMTEDANLKELCITKMVQYCFDARNERLVADWILRFNFEIFVPAQALEMPLDMSIVMDDDDSAAVEQYAMDDESMLLPVGIHMTLHHKYYFTKSLCASRNITMDQKTAMMEAVYAKDYSPSTVLYRNISNDRLPNYSKKESLWHEIT